MTNALWQRLACLCEGTGLTLHPGDVCQCGNTEVMQRAKPADRNIYHIRELKKNKAVLMLASLRALRYISARAHCVSVDSLLGVLLFCSCCFLLQTLLFDIFHFFLLSVSPVALIPLSYPSCLCMFLTCATMCAVFLSGGCYLQFETMMRELL